MALNRKYAALPDLDSAPDIYETPELTDDTSTVPTTTVRSQSDNEFEEDDNESPGISRSHLRIDQARSRFMPASVDARDVDFSDRLNGKRKSYKASSRRQRILEDGTEELGDLSDEEDAENLARKVARLKREIEEAKEEYGRQRAASKQPVSTSTDETDLATLAQTLDELSIFSDSPNTNFGLHASRIVTEGLPAAPEQPLQGDLATYTVTYAPTYQETHALAKAADFDRRLVILERAIGIGSNAAPELDSGTLPRAIVPSLETLQKQISTLAEASTSSLDSISRRVRALTQEAEQLEKQRRAAKAAQEALASTGTATPAEIAPSDDSEQLAKINALYGMLPTIENLTPLLPPLLDRLRSLRAIHAEAATASDSLDRIEKSQADMAADLKQWKEGLNKIEAGMKDSASSMEGNRTVVEGWVKSLEERLNQLL